ncbi:alpha/beta hydrolase [Patescibacteria group bacterium]|nr:alpha/beta hydrolase [Patescibacteria group bacterium]MBU1663600.1 alpha/beta hydrolase [Patescibacteria group bacterium]MBU1933915.1 alpha/beta hydrolase [Patescibacteria group bacterium]MBU2007656.1 alpha/beta hydrolase [Patescibacteria group bacterium]MBU2233849.1 alpha/beta hydrolase [Patescibacteria group bacterium]
MLKNPTNQLLILPGWDGTKKTWQDFINIARKDYEVICLELPCFGNEPCPDKIWGVKEYADFVAQKIKSLNLIKPILLGHSFGGQVAAYLAANNPELISQLILSGPTLSRPKHNLKRFIFGFMASFGKIFFQLFPFDKLGKGNFSFKTKAKKILYRLADSPDYNNTSGIKREIFKKIIRQDVTDQLSKIDLPVLIIWGGKDNYVSLKAGKKLAKLIKNSKLKIIPNGRHGLHISQPDDFYKIIRDCGPMPY